jgi:hypothetical protein
MKIAPSATPNTSRPLHITQNGPPMAVSTAPQTPTSAVASAMRAAPKRSINSPPTSASTTLGQ